ncbi:MAG: MFS transporter, partial [Planctomycetaceae bacterium]|nr:MFS transporter [Planctomycetaceae bacterium]
PSLHPRCNEMEQLHIGHVTEEARPRFQDLISILGACGTSRSLWLNSIGQFCINIGWAFLITWLPTYLKESHGMEGSQGALIVTIILAMGMIGQPIGGWATDQSVKQFGLRFGRVLPICLASLVASCAYLCCSLVDSLWVIVVCCAVVSLMTDIGNPSTWAFMQDVGGRHTGAVFGWGNMWGNLGAATSSMMVPYLMEYGQKSGSGYSLVFYACAGAFLLSGLLALGMDATKPLERKRIVTGPAGSGETL